MGLSSIDRIWCMVLLDTCRHYLAIYRSIRYKITCLILYAVRDIYSLSGMFFSLLHAAV